MVAPSEQCFQWRMRLAGAIGLCLSKQGGQDVLGSGQYGVGITFVAPDRPDVGLAGGSRGFLLGVWLAGDDDPLPVYLGFGLAAAYLLFADGFQRGQSWGKVVMEIAVVDAGGRDSPADAGAPLREASRCWSWGLLVGCSSLGRGGQGSGTSWRRPWWSRSVPPRSKVRRLSEHGE